MAQSPPLQRFGIWKDSGGTFGVEYSRLTMEAVRAAASHGMHGIGRGGIEVGGVLLGTRSGDFFRLLDWRQIHCAHSNGPSFLLSEDELARMPSWLEELHHEADTRDLQVVGWFVSHTRSGLDLTDYELEIHSRFFTKPWQIALVLQPSKFGDVEARVYRRISEESLHMEALAPTIQIAPLPVEAKTKQRSSAAQEDQIPDVIEARTGRRVSRLWPVIAVVGLALFAIASIVVGVVPGLTDRFNSLLSKNQMQPLDSVSLHALMSSPTAAEISWNGDVVQARGATRGTLEIRDGSTPTQKELSKGELYMGRFEYAMQSPRIDVTLALFDGHVLVGRETTRFRRK